MKTNIEGTKTEGQRVPWKEMVGSDSGKYRNVGCCVENVKNCVNWMVRKKGPTSNCVERKK